MNNKKKVLKKIYAKDKRAHARKFPKNKPAYISKAEQAKLQADQEAKTTTEESS